ncbi:MAG: DegT/DnrJ/EryC1/StrS family aminotransferase [Verrucomicrobia bacterium]|nr:DegT/DnrJ/EryC1/StrS family aminotransferase [Verrucomicrobiota bacterium]MCG2680225.1 DegT/DnrJ/EryC1/StrS family aminotransferase [Kiritimatiellia bacterium]MBU4247682.1 DegT/DnrJ/EryC1/StrS family aminotransferase [Verrucomicrobiota bacterium]MBU4289810.1 DegT/DnrJ/EryC1/StrS family aminotransferase [Verrucomicrobiota bacterium]MBU4428047.1 DegT/DnrJ/EryC1/StrS family aminotransferase [Verrucomicrobiota bacterium]
MQVPLLDLKAQYVTLRDELRKVIDEVCDSQSFILGPRVQAFEAHAAAYCGTKHAVGLSSGTDALLAALMALEVGHGDAVVTSPYTFFATAGSIVRLGAVPLFADIDPVTFNLNPVQVRCVLESPPGRFRERRLKVLMPVHLYGQCADMDPLTELAREFECQVVEDAAQAIGAEYPSRGGVKKAGAMGQIGCFSFFPSKNLGGFGDGGMAVTDDATLNEKLRALRVHGATVTYSHHLVGANFRLDALQAAVLDVKLTYLDSWHAARQAHAAYYNRAFQGTPVATPPAIFAGHALTHPHIYNQYVIRAPRRDQVREQLSAAGIGCAIYYPTPLHLQECFRSLGYRAGDFPESEKAARETLALPVYPELTEPMMRQVVDTVLGAL